MKKRATRPAFKLLGRSESLHPSKPDKAILETFPNRHPARPYWVRFDCREFTSMCPVTGQPDFAVIQIRYVPDRLCLETKSLKFYLASYRHTAAFNEEIVNRILDDLVAVSRPRRMVVEGRFAARGGIALSVDAEFPEISGGGSSG
jgi:7-cyano-7-deazaguanine reductase